jgi:hypothetical protein
MKTRTLFILAVFLAAQLSFARSKPMEGFSVYLVGQPEKDSAFIGCIPQGEGPVSSLCETRDGGVLGGTRVERGKSPWLFYFSLKDKIIRRESVLRLASAFPGQKCVSGLVMAADSAVYGAVTDLHDMDYAYVADVKAMNYDGGHLFKAAVNAGKISVTDLGAPIKGEGICAITASREGDLLYGVTIPSQVFFSYDIKAGKAQELGRLPAFEEEFRRYISKSTRALVADDSGNVYGSAARGKLFKYTAASKKLDTLSAELPTEGNGAAYDCITTLLRTKSGRIFGGTFLDGKLFEFLPRTGKIKDLGLTSRTGNLTGLAEKDGILYGLSGSKSSTTKYFAYNLATGEFRKFPEVKIYYENTDKKCKWSYRHLKGLVLMKNGMFATADDDQGARFYTIDPKPGEWAK